MPLRTIAGTAVQYYLIAYDESGNERREPDGSLLSETVRAQVADAAHPVTDVFFASHGWKGDLPAAIEQYDAWVGAMAGLESDLARARQRRTNFMPLVVGLHWPSLPWGDESLAASAGAGVLSADATAANDPVMRVDEFAARIANTPAARAALQTLFLAADRGVEPSADGTLPQDVRAAYATLFAESQLRAADVAAPPGADQDGFDPEAIVRDAQALDGAPGPGRATPGVLGVDIGGALQNLLLSPLRQLSFWKMKDRARGFGETGARALLAELQSASSRARFHLMGHSFGCIAVSAAVAGGAGAQPLARPVSSLFLVQGALSLWAYAPDIPYAPGTAGYFSRLIGGRLVDGPVVATRSKYDLAVGRFYPIGAEIKKQVVLGDELPKYGAIGAFGIQGLGASAEDLPMGPATFSYGFEAGRVYNLEASEVIRQGAGAAGAHSDIAHPEVAHAFWEAALAQG